MTSLPVSICAVLLLRSVLASLPAPENLTLTSNNFLHILSWKPGAGTPPGTSYLIIVSNQEPALNLTNPVHCPSTSCPVPLGLFSNVIWVQALNNGSRSPRSRPRSFKPYESTVLGPPSLALAKDDETAVRVNISLPDADGHTRIADIQKFYGASFDVALRAGSREQEWPTQARSFTLEAAGEGDLCVRARLKTALNNNTPWSPWSCMSTAGRRSDMVGVLVLVLVLVLVVCLSGLVACLGYVGLLWKPTLPRLDVLSELKPAQISKTILKPDWTPVVVPDCRPTRGMEDHQGWSYIHRGAPPSSDAASSSRLLEDSAPDWSSSGGPGGSGPQNQVDPEAALASAGATDAQHLSSDEEDEVQSEEDCVDLLSVTVAALSRPPPSPPQESHDPAWTEHQEASDEYECWRSRWTRGDDAEDPMLGSSGYMGRT